MGQEVDFALQQIEEQNIQFVRLWFTDVLGTLKSVAVSPAELDVAFSEGIGFDGSAIEGFTRVSESDMLVKPDPSTFQIMPWTLGQEPGRGPYDFVGAGSARMFGDVLTPDGNPALTDPRNVLKRVLAKSSAMGMTFHVHPEIEFYLFENGWTPGEEPTPVDQGGYFDHVPRGIGHGFRRIAINLLERLGIAVEYSHHEGGPGQCEIDLRYADALSAADNIMTFRTVVKETAIDHGVYATFMPKPLLDQPGSGMHSHLSLFDGDTNVFHEPGAQFQLSRTARQFIAGVLRHAAESTLVTNQYVNSYKRLWAGDEAPSYICWGHNNRSGLVRVPMYKPGKGVSTRIEHRGLDSAANPYLAYALILAAGLKGIEEDYEPVEGLESDVVLMSPQERSVCGVAPLPASLFQAIAAAESSEFVAETLGEQVFETLLRNKRQEWRDYRHQITPFELKRYLPLL